MERWDVAVVGAGPAGCATAASVHRRWPAARVVVLDRAAFPRDKACGDGIAYEATEALGELGFSVPDLVRGFPPLRHLELRAPGGPTVARPMRREVHVVPRRVFDARLVEQLRDFGVEVRRHDVRDLRIGAAGVEVDGRIRADVLVGADGANSVVRQALRPRQRRRDVALAIRGYGPELPGQDGVQLIAMSNRRWPAYAWSFPLGDGRANLGYGEHLGSTPLTLADLRQRMAELLPGATSDLTAVRGHHLPLTTSRPDVPDGRVLLAGDAQSLVNPVTGEGIFYAVVSGALAGQAAGETGDPGRAYGRLLQRTLGRHFRHTTALARFSRWPALVDAGVRAAAADQRVFDDLVDLGLADGRITARTVARLRWH